MICILRFGIVFVLDFVLCVSCFYRSCLLYVLLLLYRFCFYINFAAFSLFTVNSGVSLCFVNARVSFYYFKILTNFTCKRIRANLQMLA